MTADQAKLVMATLTAAYPNVTLQDSTVRVYVRSLQDFTEAEARRAVEAAIATGAWFPPISVLREFVVEERLQLESGHEAWEEVQRRVGWKPRQWRTCVACAGIGTRLYQPGDSERPEQEVACEPCGGAGRFPTDRPPALSAPVQRALDFVGGLYAVKTTDKPEIVRAQFLKAYAEFRTEAVRAANLESLGVLPEAAARAAIGP